MGGLKRVLENLRAQAGPDGPNLADIIEAQKIDLDQLRAWGELRRGRSALENVKLITGPSTHTRHTFSLNLRLDRGEIRAFYWWRTIKQTS